MKASEVVRSVISQLSRNIPSLIASIFGSVFVALLPDYLLRPPFREFRWLFALIGLWLIIYLFAMLWFARYPRRQALWHLKHIGEDEKAVLREFLKQNKSTGYFHVFDAPSASLISKGILVHSTSIFPQINAPVVIETFVMAYLRKHPEKIGLVAEDIGTAQPSPKPGFGPTMPPLL